jgi:hypothetical protein
MLQIDGPVRVSYDYWKELVNQKGWPHYYIAKGTTGDGSTAYDIVTGQRDIVAVHHLSDPANLDDWSTNHKNNGTEVASVEEASLRLTEQSGHIQQTTKQGKPVTSQFPNTVKHANQKSFDFTDKTSWYQQAKFVSKESFTASASQTDFTLNNSPVIDATQANIHDEDYLTDPDNNDRNYKIDVWVNGTKQSENSFHSDSADGDYSVDYPNGVVQFNSGLNDGDTVEVSYHYEDGSIWEVGPADGKKLSVARAEIQAGSDVNMKDTMFFEVGYYDSNNNWVNLQTPNIYKTWYDVLIESNGSLPQYYPPSSPGKRDLQTKINVFQWDYLSIIELLSSKDMKIRVRCKRDIAHSGNYLSVTFYTLVEDE